MTLRQIVDRYLQVAGGFGQTIPLARLGRSRAEIETAFSAFDEDYRISCFLHFSGGPGETYTINGFPHTHISIDEAINSVL